MKFYNCRYKKIVRPNILSNLFCFIPNICIRISHYVIKCYYLKWF